MFPVFPVLFPVCSQFHRQSFHRVPCVLGFRRSRHEHRFLYSSLSLREHWEQWERNTNRRTSAMGAVEQTWNDWEQSTLFPVGSGENSGHGELFSVFPSITMTDARAQISPMHTVDSTSEQGNSGNRV